MTLPPTAAVVIFLVAVAVACFIIQAILDFRDECRERREGDNQRLSEVLNDRKAQRHHDAVRERLKR